MWLGPAGLWPHLPGIRACFILLQLFGPCLGISSLPNLFLPQGLCACSSVCLENPAPPVYMAASSLSFIQISAQMLTQSGLWPPGWEWAHIPNHCCIPLVFQIVFLLADITLGICLALLECDSPASGRRDLWLAEGCNPHCLQPCLELPNVRASLHEWSTEQPVQLWGLHSVPQCHELFPAVFRLHFNYCCLQDDRFWAPCSP